MNLLDYSVSLRKKGLSKDEITNKLVEKAVNQSDIDYYLKKSDEVFLNSMINTKKTQRIAKQNRGFKIFILILCLVLLLGAFYGYTTLGVIGLFFVWSLVRYSSFRK